jgi:Protein of unknown function (DUF1559)
LTVERPTGNRDGLPALHELSGPLWTAVDAIRRESLSTTALHRALDQARTVRPRPRRLVPPRPLLVATAAAAVLGAAVTVWLTRPAYLWAGVTDAVQARPWIHAVGTGPGGERWEFWLSPRQQVSAGRFGPSVRYHDHRLRIYYSYDSTERILYRLAEAGRIDSQAFRLWLETFTALARGYGRLEAPFGSLELTLRNRRLVEAEGRSWEEFELTQREGKSRTVRLVFRVDPETRLPVSLRRAAEDAADWSVVFDYPEQGPGDVYALGVPAGVELVDRVPAEDLQRALDGVEAGRDRFDDQYRALVVRTADKGPWSRGVGPSQVWRKGDRWRLDRGVPASNDVRLFVGNEAPADDMAAWWLEEAKKYRYLSMTVCDGTAIYRALAPDDPAAPTPYRLLYEFGPHDTPAAGYGNGGSEAMLEFLGYPLVGRPSAHCHVSLEPKPKGGPPNTVLVQVSPTRPPPQGLSFLRCWLDPSRNYVARRVEWLSHVPPDWEMDEEKSRRPLEPGPDSEAEQVDMMCQVMEEVARSPRGVWYPTVIQHTAAMRGQPVGRSSKYVVIDFNAQVPDSLFEVPRGGQVPQPPPVVRAGNRDSHANLRQLALALHNYEQTHGCFPPAALCDKAGKPLLSWRVLLLPYLEENELYEQFRLNEPWDSAHNKDLLARMPRIFAGDEGATAEDFQTPYQVFVGKRAAFEGTKGIPFAGFTDGMSQTLLVVRAPTAVPWTKPADLPYAPDKPLPRLFGDGEGGLEVVFANGRVHTLPRALPEKTLRALITRNGGEKLDRNALP